MQAKPFFVPVDRTMRRRLVAVAIAASLAAAAAVPALIPVRDTHAATAPSAVTENAQFPFNFADIVAAVKPAVVNISVKQTVSGTMRRPSMPSGTPFDEFFKRFFEQMPQGPMHGERELEGQGSGFIVDPSGYVVTNYHVIEGAGEIMVTLNDGTRYPAALKGTDPKTDLALLKIDAPRALPHVTFGDSDRVRAGDWVVAIGNPFGLGGTVTAGIVSARGRDIQSGPFDDFIQIDAPINRGNSGGPLFDGSGKVIGVNTAIFSPNGGSVGIGFAIPASLAETIVADLRAGGTVERGWLGVQIQSVTDEIAESLGLDKTAGALVATVVPDSPAAKAGIKAGDVILQGNGTPIDGAKDLSRLVASLKPHTALKLTAWRQGTTRSIKVDIGSSPSSVAGLAPNSAPGDAGSGLGLSLAPLTPELRARYGVADSVQGAMVVEVDRSGVAARQGVRPGDIIVMVGQDKVAGPDDVAAGVAQATRQKRGSVLLLLDRQGDQRFLAVPLA